MTRNFFKKDLLIILFIFLLLFINRLFITCKIFYSFSFDSQAILLWEYVAQKGLLPIRDVFYPYGFYSFFRDFSFLMRLFEVLYLSVLFSAVYIFLKSISKNVLFSIVSISMFAILIYVNIGFEIFIRYGTTLIFSMFCSYLIFKNKFNDKKFPIVFGIFTSLIYFFFHDQSYYMVISYLFFSFANVFYYPNNITIKLKFLIIGISYFILGIFMGSLPLFAFFELNKIPNYLFLQFQEMKEIPFYSKTPYLPNFTHFDTVFLITALTISVGFIWYKLFEKKKKLLLHDFYILGISFYLLLLMQKSIVRSFDSSLVFIGVLLYYTFFLKIKKLLQDKKMLVQAYIIFIVLQLLLIFYLFKPFNRLFKETNNTPNICIEKNISNLYAKDSSYKKVANDVEMKSGFNGKIFAFPANPVFYIIFHQFPPYFSNSYDASFKKSQVNEWAYIVNSDIRFVIIDLNIKSVQDEIPESARSKYILEKIKDNFSYYKQVGHFLILQRRDIPYGITKYN